MIAIVLGAYFIIGCVIAFIGPGKEEISDQVSKARGASLAHSLMETKPPSERKLLAFRMTLSLGFVLVWPLFLPAVLRERMMRDKDDKKWRARVAAGIEFSRMGGAGTVHCRDCGFGKQITSFMHGVTDAGEDCSSTGHQCLSCGTFVSVRAEGNPVRRTVTRCQCGGELSRDHVLFCPACRSKNLHYDLEVIS